MSANYNQIRLTFILVLATVALSCSNKLNISENRFSVADKKVVFNTAFVCTAEKLNDNASVRWYDGNGEANTSIGEFVINLTFCITPGQFSFREDIFYRFYSPLQAGDMNQVTSPIHAVIAIDEKNSVWIQYPEVNYKNGLDLFGVEGEVTGGTGIFKNATGTVNSKIVTDRTNNLATTSHMAVIYMQ